MSVDVADDHRPAVADVARRHRRVERTVATATTLVAAVVVGAAVLALPLLWGAAVGLAVLVALRVPALESQGRAVLRTESSVDAVRDDFTGPRPPPLALQWGTVDDVHRTAGGWRYAIPYLFGLRSVDVEFAVRPRDSNDGAEAFDVVVTTDGRGWGTYRVTLRDDDGATVVDVEWASDRRFGLRRVPQWVASERYREDALAAQGYDVTRRDASLSV